MANAEPWSLLAADLDALAMAGRSIRFWLRDDDAVRPTPALDRLCGLVARHTVPLLLAVIPKNAADELARAIEDQPLVSPCQHGYSHRNHAAPGQRACELGLDRPLDAVLGELAEGRDTLRILCGPRLDDCLVPPWNRMDERLLPRLSALGFDAVSRFGEPVVSQVSGLSLINATIDIIDWKAGKRGRSDADLLGRLRMQIGASTESEATIGVLTHHLDHDDQAWRFLERLFGATGPHPAAGWAAFDELRGN